VAGLEGAVLADQRMAEQVEIADRVEHLVADELVVEAQALAVEDLGLVEDDRRLQAAAQAQARRPHRLDVLHEAERAGARDLAHVRMLGEVDDDVAILRAEHRMREVDAEVELEPGERVEARPLVAVAGLDGARNAQVFLRRLLLDDARRLQQEHVGPRAAIHDRQLGTGDVDVEVVDAETGERRHQVLDRRHRRGAVIERGGKTRVADVAGDAGDRRAAGEIRAIKHNAVVDGRRSQRELDARAGVQADARGAGDGLQRALLQHGRCWPRDCTNVSTRSAESRPFPDLHGDAFVTTSDRRGRPTPPRRATRGTRGTSVAIGY
jgi:hypothetical protein